MSKSKKPQKLVLITGANKGIGLEVARQLARKNFHVVIGARNAERGKAAVAEIKKAGGTATLLVIDVSNKQSIRKAAAEFAKSFSTLDVLINNAGIYPDEGVDILTISQEQLATTFQTNTFGQVEVTQSFVPFLRKSAAGRIVNLSSGYGQLDGLTASVPSYCLSKLTLNGVTLMLHQKLNPEGIAVNSMSPGWVRTDMGGAGATLSVEEGADTAVWLASEAPQELSGKFIRERKVAPW
jgi:NAD(P)-dependent dehydrogenase (short-subunit alcohol dehydrogenase family)